MNYILDTHVMRWIENIDPQTAYLSVITVGELKKGVEKLPDSRRKTILAAWLKDDLLVRFQDHLLPIDTAVMLTWGALGGRWKAATGN